MKIGHHFNSPLLLVVVSLTSMHSNLQGEEYLGFHVDYSEVRDSPNFESLRAAMNRQIDMVLAVGVADRMRNFFQRVPIKVLRGKESFAGHYKGKSKAVELTSGFLSNPRKPALLHELLHAYHDQRMPGGFRNPEVLMYYERAKASNKYDPTSHMWQMLKNSLRAQERHTCLA